MNKIEAAIKDCKLHLQNLYQDRMVLFAKIEAYQEIQKSLEAILKDENIPNEIQNN